MILNANNIETTIILSLVQLNLDIPSFALVPPHSLQSKTIAEQYSQTECVYLFTTYRVDAPNEARMFMCGSEWIKVSSEGTIVEKYKANILNTGVKYDFIAFDDSGFPIEYYEVVDNTHYVKKNYITKEIIATTYLGGYNSIPEDKKSLLENFQHKDRIFAWSDKTTGFVVHYIDPK